MCLLVVRLYMRLRRVGHQSPPHTRSHATGRTEQNRTRTLCVAQFVRGTGPPSYKFGGYNRAQAGTG